MSTPGSFPTPSWNADGLVPAVVQDAATGAVLMMAWMNAEAWALTQTTGEVHFWSRSRRALWRKGGTSGNVLAVVRMWLDCDGDTVLIAAHPAGPACHTGAPTCFIAEIPVSGAAVPARVDARVLDVLAKTLVARRDDPAATRSYTRRLLDGGIPAINAKLAEEQAELTVELAAGPDARVVAETADLLYHVLVGLTARGIAPTAVWAELARRFGVSGLDEKAARPGA